MRDYNITSAKYIKDIDNNNSVVRATINGIVWDVPMKNSNMHYAAILEWAEEDGNEIQAAE